MNNPDPNKLRLIPSVDSLLGDPEFKSLPDSVPQRLVVESVRITVEEFRKRLLAGTESEVDENSLRQNILNQAKDRAQTLHRPAYRRAINATGIILHTGLGRAVLPMAAVEQIGRELAGYSLLQIDPETGLRSRRDERIEWLLQQLTGCEAATVVNNNAAATAIVLNTVAKNKEVIVSRGQLLEIGGAFRLPEVMAAAGAKLVEVGTTNKTHLRDYEAAITENTAAILRVHPSNYKIVGFTAEVELDRLVKLTHEKNLVLIDDVGAGALIDYSQFGFEKEPTLPESVKSGADLITSSADKLIGGSQGGLILGKAKWVQAVRKNPFARIVRVGKLTLAALEATLALFLDPDRALREVPTLQLLMRPRDQLASRAQRMAEELKRACPGLDLGVIDGFSQMGSGSLPGQNLPTRLVAIRSSDPPPGELARRLRLGDPPVVTRVHDDRILIDPRTLLDGEDTVVVEAVQKAVAHAA